MQLTHNIRKDSDAIPLHPNPGALPLLFSRRPSKDELYRLAALLGHNDELADTKGLRVRISAGLGNTLNIARKLMLLHYYHIE